MFEQDLEIFYYAAANGRLPFREWFEDLRDYKTRVIIDARMTRLRTGNFGNCRSVGPNLIELKIDYGPGYRIYFGRISCKVILLLCGGDKSTQKKDILTADQYWGHFKETHG